MKACKYGPLGTHQLNERGVCMHCGESFVSAKELKPRPSTLRGASAMPTRSVEELDEKREKVVSTQHPHCGGKVYRQGGQTRCSACGVLRCGN